MWRGGGRVGLSVAAPFVWRCPSNLAMASVSTSPSSNRTCRSPPIRLSDKISRLRPRPAVLQVGFVDGPSSPSRAACGSTCPQYIDDGVRGILPRHRYGGHRRGWPRAMNQWPELAVGLGYPHSSDRLRSIRLLSERKRSFPQPPLHPVRVDIRKVLAVYARCTLVRTALGIGMCQDIFAIYLVVQGVEAEARFCLRFRV